LLRDERNKLSSSNEQLENMALKLEGEITKRENTQKRVKKFAKWLHRDQKIYIEGLLQKLGIEDVAHKRATSCMPPTNQHFHPRMPTSITIHIDPHSNSRGSYRDGSYDNNSEYPSDQITSMKSINRFACPTFSPDTYASRQSIYSTIGDKSSL
jgi:hypothetical protein